MSTQRNVTLLLCRLTLAGMMGVGCPAIAQVTVTDNFTGGGNSVSWFLPTSPAGTNTACLTAGTGVSPTSGVTAIPACGTGSQAGGSNNTCANGTTHAGGCLAAGVLDGAGYGALRLTNAVGSKYGAIVYNNNFASNAGISITFTAVSYDGDSGSNGGLTPVYDGADGLSFFLLDGSVDTTASPVTIGSWGGSLGYSCSNINTPYTGITGGYVGLGIDEYGNFLNNSDNTATGVLNTATGNTTSQFQGNRIGLRGVGNVNWRQLNAGASAYYPSSLSSGNQSAAVQNTCQTGTLWNYSNSSSPFDTGQTVWTNWTQLNAAQPTYYPSSLTASEQTFAVSQTLQNATLYNFSAAGSNSNSCVVTVTWSQLHSANSTYYPSSLSSSKQTAATTNTCQTGTLWNYSNSSSPVNTGTLVTTSNVSGAVLLYSNTGTAITTTNVPGALVLYDYAPIANGSVFLGTTNLLANESAGARENATSRTYNLKITSNGLLTLNYAINNTQGFPGTPVPVLTNSPIFSANGTLPANFKFGFAASTGGSNNIHEIMCFQAAPAEDTNTSAGLNAVQTGQVQIGTAVYLAYYHSHDWWGQLTSQNLVYNSATNSVTISTTANWDSDCVLTGDNGAIAAAPNSSTTSTLPGTSCAATGSSTDVAEAPVGGRQILSWSGSAGIPFEWSSLTSAQQTSLGSAQTLLNYLRGDRSNEVSPTTGTGLYRARIGVLGDIMDSSPTWVGVPNLAYPTGAWQDLLYPSATMPESTNTYGAFQTAQSSRLNVVYAGSNDGMLHGYEAGYYTASTGTTGTASNDGKEVIAYMPNAIVSTIHNTGTPTLDYSNPVYGHNYFVDATPGFGDLYYNNAWHTWLVGGLAAGGNAIYALDITNPSAFSESNASSLVTGEWNSSTTGLGSNLGLTFGTPQISRLHTGNWAIIFGNGYQAPSNNGGVFVGQVSSTGTVSFTFLALPASAAGTATNPNGIFSANAVDLDGDGVADYIYAGDLYGNVWRWDITSNTVWPPAAPIRLFSTPSGQPISTQVQVGAGVNPNGMQRLIVNFGTGEQIPSTSGTTYATVQQALYGIWDGNMATWNANSNVNTTHKYDPFPSSITQPYTVLASGLELQTTTATGTLNGESYRTVSTNPVCWADGLSTCTTYPQYGWVYDLPAPSNGAIPEQVVANPLIVDGAFLVNTYIASNTQNCSTSNPTGWTMSISPVTGGAFPTSFFVNSAGINISGLQTSATGSPSIVEAFSSSFLINQTSNPPSTPSTPPPPPPIQPQSGIGFRLNWTELR
jgi:type IV pilus assembly protein PilY1